MPRWIWTPGEDLTLYQLVDPAVNAARSSRRLGDGAASFATVAAVSKLRLLVFTLAITALGPASRADSGLRLPYPDFFGEIPAATYDDTRVRVGSANLRVEKLESGNV